MRRAIAMARTPRLRRRPSRKSAAVERQRTRRATATVLTPSKRVRRSLRVSVAEDLERVPRRDARTERLEVVLELGKAADVA